MKRTNSSPRAGQRIVNEPVREVPVYDGPSKSQRKRDSHALQELGVTLVGLQPAKLRTLPLPDNRNQFERTLELKFRPLADD